MGVTKETPSETVQNHFEESNLFNQIPNGLATQGSRACCSTNKCRQGFGLHGWCGRTREEGEKYLHRHRIQSFRGCRSLSVCRTTEGENKTHWTGEGQTCAFAKLIDLELTVAAKFNFMSVDPIHDNPM